LIVGQRQMITQDTSIRLWPVPLAVVCAIVCFAATFFQIAEGVRLKEPRGLAPVVIGSVVFAALMFFFTDALIAQKGKRRVGVSIAIVAAETAVFVYGVMFLLLNIYGS